eukprot:5628713-Amphidinium_carterae.2
MQTQQCVTACAKRAGTTQCCARPSENDLSKCSSEERLLTLQSNQRMKGIATPNMFGTPVQPEPRPHLGKRRRKVR